MTITKEINGSNAGLTYYRGIEFIKDYFIKFFNKVFYANEKGDIIFNDGTKIKTFSRKPFVVKKGSWNAREIPAVIVGSVNGKIQVLAVPLDLLDKDSDRDDITYGGDIDVTVNFDIYATSIEERDILTDISSIFLSHPATKMYAEQHYIRLPEAPTIREGGTVNQPGIDYPIYFNTITMRAVGTWRYVQDDTDYDLLYLLVNTTIPTT